MDSASLPPSTIAALRKATEDACLSAIQLAKAESQFPDPRITTLNWPQTVLTVVNSVISQIAAQQHAKLPLARLPPEVLTGVFYWLSDNDRLNAIAACKWWKDLLLSTPALWTFVDFNRPRAIGALEKVLSLSGDVPLDQLDVCVTVASVDEVCRCLETHIARAKLLSVSIDEMLGSTDVARLAAALSRPTPLLRTFRLFDHYAQWNKDMKNDSVLFGGRAPKLRKAKVNCSIAALANSRSAFTATTHVLYSQAGALTTSLIEQAVALFSSIVELAIEVDSWSDSELDGPSGSVQFPEQLVQLMLIVNHHATNPCDVIEPLHLAAVPRVWLSYNRPAFVSDVGQAARTLCLSVRARNIQVVRLDISTYDSETFNMHLSNVPLHKSHTLSQTSAAVRHWERVVLDIKWNAVLPPELFANLTTLYIGESLFSLTCELPEMPRLTTLTVVLLTRSDIATHGHQTIFLPLSPTNGPLRCPALQHLRISAREGRATVDPLLLHEFIHSYLKYDAELLATLTLCAVELVQNRPQDVAVLLSSFANFTFEEERLEWIREESDLLYWNGLT